MADASQGDVVMPLARLRTKLLVFAPRRGPVEMLLDIEPPGGSNSSVIRCRVLPGMSGGRAFRRALRSAPTRVLDVVRGTAARVRFEAEGGVNAVVLMHDGVPQRLKDVVVRASPTNETARERGSD